MQWQPLTDGITIDGAVFGGALVRWPCPCGAQLLWNGQHVTVCTQCGRLHRVVPVIHVAGPPEEPGAGALRDVQRALGEGT